MSFRKYDVVEMVVRRKAGDRTERVVLNSVEEVEEGWRITYSSAEPEKTHWYGWGSATIRREPKPFGIQSAVVVGRCEPVPAPRPPNLFGHPSYDLMHDPRRR